MKRILFVAVMAIAIASCDTPQNTQGTQGTGTGTGTGTTSGTGTGSDTTRQQ